MFASPISIYSAGFSRFTAPKGKGQQLLNVFTIIQLSFACRQAQHSFTIRLHKTDFPLFFSFAYQKDTFLGWLWPKKLSCKIFSVSRGSVNIFRSIYILHRIRYQKLFDQNLQVKDGQNNTMGRFLINWTKGLQTSHFYNVPQNPRGCKNFYYIKQKLRLRISSCRHKAKTAQPSWQFGVFVLSHGPLWSVVRGSVYSSSTSFFLELD